MIANPLAPTVFLTGAPSYAAADPTTYLAVDANPYSVRLTHTIDGVILDTLEAGAHHISRMLNFVRRIKRRSSNVILTGARTDRWPPGLCAVLVQEFGPISWAPQLVLAQTAAEFRRSTRLFKFFRATYLAACAQTGPNPSRTDLMIKHWKEATLAEIAFNLDVGPPPDIPF